MIASPDESALTWQTLMEQVTAPLCKRRAVEVSCSAWWVREASDRDRKPLVTQRRAMRVVGRPTSTASLETGAPGSGKISTALNRRGQAVAPV
jgi:hypothetical protein